MGRIFDSCPTRVQVENYIGCVPLQNQPSFAEVSVTEVVQKSFFTSKAAGLQLSVPSFNNLIGFQQPLGVYSNIRNQSTSITMPNPMMLARNVNNFPVTHHYPHNFSPNSFPLNYPNSRDLFEMKNELLFAQSLSNGAFGNNNNILNDQSLKILPTLSRMSTNTMENCSQQTRVPNNPNGDHHQSESDDDESYDGVTHSLPCNKNGPYTCPKCMEGFSTSLLFATHVLRAHYKYETSEERQKRKAAKNRNKKPRKLHIVNTPNGLTIAPKKFKATWMNHFDVRTLMVVVKLLSTTGVKIKERDYQLR
ncbi:uncharacterized protein LOC110806991 [Carica papaya]|uniref:uncharacterized protein LOC110806991 n=1 Tax=Carica papaya TaxID=3649 RepID=UPI000B8CDBE3|nr:uncharacterized protein LOC110806991 [Carica papaya]